MFTQTDFTAFITGSGVSEQRKADLLAQSEEIYLSVSGSPFLKEQLAEDHLTLLPYFSEEQTEEILALVREGNEQTSDEVQEFLANKDDLMREGKRLLRGAEEDMSLDEEEDTASDILDAIDHQS